MVERYPKLCDAMLKAVPLQYRLKGTGFTKATISLNNPVRHSSAGSNDTRQCGRVRMTRNHATSPRMDRMRHNPRTAIVRARTPARGWQTPLHYDDNERTQDSKRTPTQHACTEEVHVRMPFSQNFGLTFLIAFDVNGNLVPGSGSHVLCSADGGVAVQVSDSVDGVVFVGDYRRVLHSNRAVTTSDGERLIVTAYCSQTLVDLVA